MTEITTKETRPDWIPYTGTWIIYLMTTPAAPSDIQGFPNVDAYLYIGEEDSVMGAQDFYDLLQVMNGNANFSEKFNSENQSFTDELLKNSVKIIGQFTEQNVELLTQINTEYGVTWLSASDLLQDAAKEG